MTQSTTAPTLLDTARNAYAAAYADDRAARDALRSAALAGRPTEVLVSALRATDAARNAAWAAYTSANRAHAESAYTAYTALRDTEDDYLAAALRAAEAEFKKDKPQ